MTNDQSELDRLIAARHTCISITTPEEDYVLALLGEIAVERGMEMSVWSVTTGLREGLLSGATPAAGTEHPAAALYTISQGGPQLPQGQTPGMYVMLDLAGHLKDERTMRALREAVAKVSASGGR